MSQPPGPDIRVDDLTHPGTQELLRIHLAEMHHHSPPGQVHALDLSGLKAPAITVWTLWRDGQPVGIAALKQLDPRNGEIKSMRTHPDYLRQGVAAALLDHIIGVARERGMTRLSLETGSGAAFAPALALYQVRGFRSGPAFGAYRASAFNQFLHLSLAA